MIKKVIVLLMFFFVSHGVCGVSVIGTRFMIDDKMQHLNIKIVNDNESDYLIKSVLDDSEFIISPPLFLLNKNSSNIITIIPKNKEKQKKDKVINLTITSIPRSTVNDDGNSISMAVRNHFKIIYRHKELLDTSFDKLYLINEGNQCDLVNRTEFGLTVSFSKEKNEPYPRIINLPPDKILSLGNLGVTPHCEFWINFYNEYNDIIKTLKSSELLKGISHEP